jgi:hypothetical protein
VQFVVRLLRRKRETSRSTTTITLAECVASYVLGVTIGLSVVTVLGLIARNF